MGDINLAIGIMAIPEREENVNKIIEVLNTDSVKVFYDFEHTTPYETSKKAFTTLAQQEDITHILVIQDDVKICENFLDIVYKVIEANSDVILNLYNPRFNEYNTNTSPYFVFDVVTMFSGQAIIMPRDIAIDCFDWCDKHPDRRKIFLHADDSSIKIYANARKVKLVGTKVSLVQHLKIKRADGRIPITHQSRLFLDDFEDKDKINWQKKLSKS